MCFCCVVSASAVLSSRACTLHTSLFPFHDTVLVKQFRKPAAARTCAHVGGQPIITWDSTHAQVNGQPIKAFVDSGAQSSIMSQDCARRCNLLHLLDKRFQGMAVGVGSGKIVGQIHQVRREAAVHAAHYLRWRFGRSSGRVRGWALELLE